MKQYLPILISVISCAVALLCMLRISSLESQMNSLKNDMNNNMTMIRNDVLAMNGSIDDKLEEKASLLSTGDYYLQNPDLRAGSAELYCSITPKEFSPANTTAVLLCNEQEIPMTLRSGAFVVSVPVPLLETVEITSVTFSSGGTVRTQALDWTLNPRELYLPSLYAKCSGSSTGTVKNDTYVWRYNGKLEVSVEQKGGLETEVYSLDLVQYNNGVEVERLSLLGEVREGTYFGKPPAATIDNEDPFQLSYDLTQSYEIPFGTTMELIVEMNDGSDYIHRVLLNRFVIDDNGTLDEREIPIWRSSAGNIYDLDGKLLYGTDWNDENNRHYWNNK